MRHVLPGVASELWRKHGFAREDAMRLRRAAGALTSTLERYPGWRCCVEGGALVLRAPGSDKPIAVFK